LHAFSVLISTDWFWFDHGQTVAEIALGSFETLQPQPEQAKNDKITVPGPSFVIGDLSFVICPADEP
jgi:hypothetical protein